MLHFYLNYDILYFTVFVILAAVADSLTNFWKILFFLQCILPSRSEISYTDRIIWQGVARNECQISSTTSFWVVM